VVVLWIGFVAAAAAQAPDEVCAARVLDYSGWQAAADQSWDYRWTGDGSGALTVMGAEHQRDPAHPQFARIAAAFAEARPTVAFFEGPDRGVGSNAEDTIRSRGESGFVRLLAAQAQASVRSLEPSPGDQIGALLAEHPLDQVNLFFVLRETARLRDREGRTGAALDEAVLAVIGRSAEMAARGGLSLPVTDVATLDATARRYWPDRDWRTLPAGWFSPGADDAATGGVFLGAINRSDSMNRDRHMVRQLLTATRAGERVFAVVGRNHVPMQAPALDCGLRGNAP
jgi:hypothetical protein